MKCVNCYVVNTIVPSPQGSHSIFLYFSASDPIRVGALIYTLGLQFLGLIFVHISKNDSDDLLVFNVCSFGRVAF